MPNQVSHPLFARIYARLSPGAESRGLGAHRDELLAGLAGRVLEVGAGNGLNFAHYPRTVQEVIAVEPEAHLRGLAVEAAAQAPVPVRVLDAVAGDLPFAEGSFDHVVFSLALCSVADPAAALAEAHRVLRADGGLRYLEHVVAHGTIAAWTQRVLDVTVWPRLAGGCHLARDTGALIRENGFSVDSERRVKPTWEKPAIPHVLGRASRV
ncbi:MAG TPA: class I SAM-dependent methyltransferase [Solirubrobacteraceae bacterium]